MIYSIKFKSGASPQSSPIEIEVAPVTVFVGPNNAGKSKILTEIEQWSIQGSAHGAVILDTVSFLPLTAAEVDDAIKPFKVSLAGYGYAPNTFVIGRRSSGNQAHVQLDQLYQTAGHPQEYPGDHTYAALRSIYTVRLDGLKRLNLLDEQPAGDLQDLMPNSALEKLFRSNPLRQRVRDIIFDAIGRYFVIDPTKLGSFRVRFSARPPATESEERGITEDAVAFHGAADDISKVSDGVKAFAGIITTLVADDPKIILIDEPEAFLHPALAMKLGKEVGRTTNEKKRLFVATHSAAFIMGCIQSASPINIVRLTFKNGISTTRLLDRSKLLHLMRNPMLRSTGVLDGLFYEAVIVTEADADRAFYQEINERLRSFNDPRGINNCLFINAQNKQTVWDIVKPLREIGIPAVGIVDLDMVKDGGVDFSRIMHSTFVPGMQHNAMSSVRVQLKEALDAAVPANSQSLDATKNWWKRNGGISLLNAADNQAANNYFSQMEEYGAFVVRNGELEYWLKYLNVPANKKRWLADIFIAMGEDPALPSYVASQIGDVWDFIGRIKNWVENSARFGIPE